MCSNIEIIIYCFIDSLCIENRYMMVTYYITLFVSLLLNYMPYHILCICGMHVTPTMSSVTEFIQSREANSETHIGTWPCKTPPHNSLLANFAISWASMSAFLLICSSLISLSLGIRRLKSWPMILQGDLFSPYGSKILSNAKQSVSITSPIKLNGWNYQDGSFFCETLYL
jgi:hypothetical protein